MNKVTLGSITPVTSISGTLTPDAGKSLHVVFRGGARNVSCVTDSRSNTWTKVNGRRWVSRRVPSGPTTITATFKEPTYAWVEMEQR